MNDKEIIEKRANEIHGGFLNGKIREDYENMLSKYPFEETHIGIKKFLESKGFEVIDCGSSKFNHYAITKDHIYLSSNGYCYKEAN